MRGVQESTIERAAGNVIPVFQYLYGDGKVVFIFRNAAPAMTQAGDLVGWDNEVFETVGKENKGVDIPCETGPTSA